MNPIRRATHALLAVLLLLPMLARAHDGHGWDGLSHAWQHAVGAVGPWLAAGAVVLLTVGLCARIRPRSHERSVVSGDSTSKTRRPLRLSRKRPGQ
jgi:hypothetical protein